MGQHARREIDPVQRADRQVVQRHPHEPGAAAEVERRAGVAARRLPRGEPQQGGAHQAGDAIAEGDELRIEPVRAALEDRADVGGGGAVRVRRDAGGGDQLAYGGILRGEPEGRVVCVRRLGVAGEAGQAVAEQGEQAGVGHAGPARVLCQCLGGGEILPPDRQQHGGGAQLHPARHVRDAGGEGGGGARGVAAGGLGGGQGFDEDRVRGGGGDRLGQARHGVGRAAEFGHQNAQDRLAGGITGVERDRFGGVDRRGHMGAAAVVQIGAQPAQPGMGGCGGHPRVELGARLIKIPGCQGEAGGEIGRRRAGRGEPAQRGQHGAGAGEFSGVDHLAHPAGEQIGIGG